MTPNMTALLPRSIGWYGKLPSRGDFVGRGLPQALLTTWDEWLQRSLTLGARRFGAAELRKRLLAMPAWQFVALTSEPGASAWCGAVAASTDRVGRVFPLLLAEAHDADALCASTLSALHERTRSLTACLQQSQQQLTPTEFERSMERLGRGGVASAFDNLTAANGDTLAALRLRWPTAASFWWSDAPFGGATAGTLPEAWPPREGLLLDWLGEPA